MLFFLLRDMLGPKPVFRPKIPSTTSDTSDLDIGTLSNSSSITTSRYLASCLITFQIEILVPCLIFLPSLPHDSSQTLLYPFPNRRNAFILTLSGASPPESPSITETSINYIQLDLDNTGWFGFLLLTLIRTFPFPAAAPGAKLTSPTYKTDLASPSAIGIQLHSLENCGNLKD